MDEQTSQIYSRLTAHEFALEAIAVVLLAGKDQAYIDAWLAETHKLADRFWTRSNPAATDIEATRIARDSVEMTHGLLNKVATRVAQIRAGSGQAGEGK